MAALCSSLGSALSFHAQLQQGAQVWGGKKGGPQGSHSTVLLPAFFRTLSGLWQRGQRYTIVVRTFGTDMDRVAAALDAFSDRDVYLCNVSACLGIELLERFDLDLMPSTGGGGASGIPRGEGRAMSDVPALPTPDRSGVRTPGGPLRSAPEIREIERTRAESTLHALK